MAILCGVDGSSASRDAARGAAALARRAGEDLELLYVQDAALLSGLSAGEMAPITSSAVAEADRERMEADLEALAGDLTRDFGVRTTWNVEFGFPEQELARRAGERKVSFVVVGAIGRQRGSMWRLGSVADRISQSSPAPVLVLRAAQALVRWALEERPLRVAVALAKEESSAIAVKTLQSLTRIGPCEVVEVHAYDPWRESSRLGLSTPHGEESRRVIERALARELADRFEGSDGRSGVRFVALPSRGHTAEVLAEFAARDHADLMIVGTRGRGALQRRFTGSVSYALVGLASGNVLVARGSELRREPRAPRSPASVRRLLVATDLSETGNHAVDYALALLPEGGQLTLLHVLDRGREHYTQRAVVTASEELRLDRALARTELEKLLPDTGRAVETLCEVLDADDVTRAILQSAERNGADLLVLGRHGHGALLGAWMGSVAREVSQLSHRPVLLVPDTAPPA